ncbi:MAG TPA: D-glycero-beta-D-manno-heptose 1-phosphate adenylyltransferase [Glaciihabitans sp.]|nr:D-glycero-beta-D-manno-heptose 1-phosphate adenylyltransferase [Glaciihabitans sp.]
MRILVVGDVLLDADITGSAERLSPDAPVPVVEVGAISHRAGGAGLAATILARDGHAVTLATALGDDFGAATLRTQLSDIALITCPSNAPTPTKTRVRAAGHAVVRFDENCGAAPTPQVSAEIIQAVRQADAILVADYGRGITADNDLRSALLERGRAVPVVWDPHPKGTDPVATTWVATPNLAEAITAAPTAARGIEAASAAARVLRSRWGCGAVAVTLGERGVLLDTGGSYPQVISVPPVATADPCGAGDKFAASLVSALGQSVPLDAAVQRAARDASAFLDAGGILSLESPSHQDTILGESPTASGRTHSEAERVVQRTRARGGTVVATGGCFDLLHAGHARTLFAARALGDCLVVCLNSDSSVRRLKGVERPIVDQADRADLLSALECVDGVVIFDEDTPEKVLGLLQPDIWVKGGDYSSDELPEAALLASWGGTVVTVPYHPGRSTTRLATALARVS